MEIIVVGKFYEDGFASHIADTLSNMGHIVLRYNPGFKQRIISNKFGYRLQQIKQQFHHLYSHSSSYRQSRKNELMALTEGHNVDLVLACHDFLYPEEIQFFKKIKKAVTALWFPDAVSNFGKAMFLNADYDFLFFKEPFVAYILKTELEKNAYYLPECCNPIYHKPPTLITEEEVSLYSCDITTAGNMHTARAALFSLMSNYDVKIWGNPAPSWMNTSGWEKFIMNKYVTKDDKNMAFNTAKIVLNNIHPAEFCGINVRTFEICASGGFQMVNYRPAINQLYNAGEDLVVYNSISQLKELIDYYLPRPEERRLIAKNGCQKTLIEHTYETRLQLLLNTIEGKRSGYQYNIDCHNFSFT